MKSLELLELLRKKGYPEDFCNAITYELNTDFTAKRMIGYLKHYQKLPMEEVVDEMLAILSDRESYIQKKQMIDTQIKWNDYLINGFENSDEATEE